MPTPPRSRDRLDDGHMTAEVHRRWGGSSYPWSRFMAGCPILISMASLTFLLNQPSSLASTLTLKVTYITKNTLLFYSLQEVPPGECVHVFTPVLHSLGDPFG